MQHAIPCWLMRGGTSRGPFFLASDLPADVAQRDAVLLAAMGSPDARQIDGLGGADPLTSKVGIVSRSQQPGDARIDGVPGTSAPIRISFLDTAGSVCGKLLPTGRLVDEFSGVSATCIDNGMPVVILDASDFGKTGYESRDELNADLALKAKLEHVRLQAGAAMGLGDVTKKVVPKMCLVAPPSAGGSICTRTFIPRDCHAAVGVLGAVTVATACVMPGSVAHALASVPEGQRKVISVEHLSGEFSVELELEPDDPQAVRRAALLRTARTIMRGEVLIPRRSTP